MAKKTKLVEKKDKAYLSNLLNEMVYEEKMTLSELRFFLVYLSKLDPNKPDDTERTFRLKDYAEILGVEQNEALVAKITRKLLRYVVCVRPEVLDENVLEEYSFCQVFSRSRFHKEKKDGEWYLTFNCHEDIKPQIFKLKNSFTRFEVWNIINLKSFQDARLYMLLKQYIKSGERTIPLVEIKKMLGIDETAYQEYKIFSRDVLKKAQKALATYTDIKFDFKAVGRPAHSVHFTIEVNDSYVIPQFLAPPPAEVEESEAAAEFESARYAVLKPFMEICKNEFTLNEIQEIVDILSDYNSTQVMQDTVRVAYNSLLVQAERRDIPNRHGYLKGILKNLVG